MKLKLLLLCLLFVLLGITVAQTVIPYIALLGYNFTAAGNNGGIDLRATGATYVKVTFTKTGTVTVCSLVMDSSADKITWGNGDVLGATDCSANGTSAAINGVYNYVRVRVTSWTGTGSVMTVFTAYQNNPAGVSTAGTGTELQYRVSASALGAVTGSSVSGANVVLNGTLQVGPGSASDSTTAVKLFASRGATQYTLCASVSDQTCQLVVAKTDAGLGNTGTCGSRYCVWTQTSGEATATFVGATTANHLVIVDAATGKAKDSAVLCTATDLSSLAGDHIVGCVPSTNGGAGDYLFQIGQGFSAAGAGTGGSTNSVTTPAADTLAANGSFASTYTIAANAIAVGTPIDIWAWITVNTGGTGPNIVATVSFGGTTVCSGNTGLLLDTGDTAAGFIIHCQVFGVTTGAPGSTLGQGTVSAVTSGGNNGTMTVQHMPATTAAITTTGTNVVSVGLTSANWQAATAKLQALFIRIN